MNAIHLRTQQSLRRWQTLVAVVLAIQTGNALALDFGPLVLRPDAPAGPSGVIRLTDGVPLGSAQMNVRLASAEAYRALGLAYDPALASVSVSTHAAPDGSLSVELRPLPPPAAAQRVLEIVLIVFQGTSLQTRHYHVDPQSQRAEVAGIDPSAEQTEAAPSSRTPAPMPAAATSTANTSSTSKGAATQGAGATAARAASARDPGDAAARAAIGEAVKRWASAWARRDVESYAAAYEGTYRGTLSTHAAWVAQRRERILARQTIQVDISELEMEVRANQADVRFTQRYRGDQLRTTDRKRLLMVRQDGAWLIREEAVL